MDWARCENSRFYWKGDPERPLLMTFIDPVNLEMVTTSTRRNPNRAVIVSCHLDDPMESAVLVGQDHELYAAWLKRVLEAKEKGDGWVITLLDNLDVDEAFRNRLLTVVEEVLFMDYTRRVMTRRENGTIRAVPIDPDAIQKGLESVGVYCQ
jgi:hypothetical protein